jgi:GT2 family glycosyltransferase
MKRITAIILTFNDVEDTIQCVESLLQSTYPVETFYILDNGSTTEGVFVSLKTAFGENESCKVMRSEQNLGFSAGVNICLREAVEENPDYLLLVNNDAVIDKECIKKLVSTLETHKDALLCGPSILYHSRQDVLWHGAAYFSWIKTAANNPGHNELFTVPNSAALEVDTISGCVMLIKSRAMEEVGFFDESFFFYTEDLDYCLRVKQIGQKVIYNPQAVAFHKIDPTFNNRANKFVYYHSARSKMVLARKHFGLLYTLMAFLVQGSFGTLNKIIQSFRSRMNPLPLVYVWFGGLIDGLFRPSAPRRY